jgi:glutamate-1-semialdehyde aminotransferase
MMQLKKSQSLWEKAKKIIPGGNQLLSKRSEMFLPERWPSYYVKAKGVEIWDLDGNRYTDMSIMGVGACILGYSDEDVNTAVKRAVDAGSMATLNCPEEIELAELLIKLNPWAGMVRYARTGGEAMVVAIRIARAHTRKDKIAFCGYHGWHDWYLAANLADDVNLDGHLLPGLEPAGVPRGLKGTALPFNYNNIAELEKIVESNDDIGVIVLESIRNDEPENNFLGKVRKIADEIGAVLIFDEITSGWRLTIGGAYMLYKAFPDIVVYGKAMSNGFPMAAIVGKTDVMNAAQSTFISSTYWTERVGPTAAIATITKLENKNVPRHLIDIGRKIKKGWKLSASEHGIDIDIAGIDPLPHFNFQSENALVLKTLFTQQMLKKDYLASTALYASYAHKNHHVTGYFDAVDGVFGEISKAIDEGNPEKHLLGPVCHSGFKRLT